MLAATQNWCAVSPKDASAALCQSIALQNLGRLAEALRAADTAISLAPTDANNHYQQACVCALSGETEAALAAIGNATDLESELASQIAVDGDFESLRGSDDFRKFDGLAATIHGNEQLNAGDAEAALRSFTEATRLAPDSEDAFYGRALSAWQLGDHQELLRATEEWIKLDDESIRPLLYRFDALVGAEGVDAAGNVVQRLLQLDPDGPSSHFVHARWLGLQSRKEECLVALRKTLELRPDLAAGLAEHEDFATIRNSPVFHKLLAEFDR